DLDVVLVAQQVVYLDAGKADIQRVDRQLGYVEVIDDVAVDQLPRVGVVATDVVDLAAGIFSHLHNAGKSLLAAQGKVAPEDVQAGKQQVGGAGGLGQVDDLPHITLVHGRTCQQHRALGQAAAGLVHRDRRHVRAGRHRTDGHVFAKI